MKIKVSEGETTFGELKGGDVFAHQGRVFIKWSHTVEHGQWDQYNQSCNCCNLENGSITSFQNQTSVIQIVDATLVKN